MAAGTQILRPLCLRLEMMPDHGGGLRDIRQRNQRPDWRTAHALDHLHIDSERCLRTPVMTNGAWLQEAEQRRAYRGRTAGHQITHAATPSPITMNWANDKGVGEKDGQYQRTHRDDDRRDNPARCVSTAFQ